MQLKELTVTYGGKLNLGDYNSAHVEATATALIDDGETVEQAAGQLFEQVKAAVRVHVRELAGKRGARVDEIFAGLPVDIRTNLE